MTADAFQIAGGNLSGHGLSFDVAGIVTAGHESDEVGKRLVEIAEVSFRQGRAAAQLPYDDRFEMHGAVDTLRALAVIVGPIFGERHRRVADVIARLLQDQEAGK